ncbi:MAG: hypothetical protein NTV49_13945 [Kiritimatiellaeota bacterium]|nr:hypothetical protein [Kiritimatiellota bacterium]
MSKKACESKAQREVWAWKEASYREVAHLTPLEALRQILRRSRQQAEALGFYATQPAKHRSPLAKVAETRARYQVKK